MENPRKNQISVPQAGQKDCKPNLPNAKHFERGILITGTSHKELSEEFTSEEAALIREPLEKIFSHHGNVIITFPCASYKEIRNEVKIFRRELYGTFEKRKTSDKKGTQCHDEDIGAPQTGDIKAAVAAAEESVKHLDKVSESVLPCFSAVASKLIEERGAVELVSAALAYISGMTNKVKLLSSQHNTQFSGGELKTDQLHQMSAHVQQNTQFSGGKSKTDQLHQMSAYVQQNTQFSGRRFKMHTQNTQFSVRELPLQQMMLRSHFSNCDIHVDTVIVCYQTIQQYRTVIEESMVRCNIPIVDNPVVAVTLETSANEVLAVNPSHNYRVYFKLKDSEDYDDCSVFLRVKFQGNTSLMMFINLHSCQAISCDEHDNLFTNPPDSTFSWLDSILSSLQDFQHTKLFVDEGENNRIGIKLAGRDGWISKAESVTNSPAIISTCATPLNVEHYIDAAVDCED